MYVMYCIGDIVSQNLNSCISRFQKYCWF